MAGWLSVLKVVPWADVIAAAPKVAGGARKLWDAVGRKPEPGVDGADMPPAPEDPTIALGARLDRADGELADLRAKLQSATGLIASLAEQNEQLIAKIDLLRVRTLWLGGAAGLALLGAIAALLVAGT
jgi:hypothetical protein